MCIRDRVDEVMGGVPLGTLTGGTADGLPVVTKAGGFGTEDVLVRAVRAIRDRRFKRCLLYTSVS